MASTRTPYHVAEAFVRGEPAQAGAFVSHGDTIYSYALKLAHRHNGEIEIDASEPAPSVTTARHMNALKLTLGLGKLRAGERFRNDF